MSVYIDRKYLLLVSSRLDRFIQKNNDLFNFRCPICGDSKKNSFKARGYIYRKNDGYFYTCKNCGVGLNFRSFLKNIDQSLDQEYVLERYKNDKFTNYNSKKEKQKEESDFDKLLKLDIPSIRELEDNHFAKRYVVNRMIPQKFYDKLFYANDFSEFVKSLNLKRDYKLVDGDKRLVIPFYNSKNEIIYIQGRALSNDNKLRYITIVIDEQYPKIFGLERLNKNKKIYVVEGPIDSLFLDNCIAVADSSLTKSDVIMGNKVLIFDNEPRNREIVKQISKAIKTNHSICLFPENIIEKDINDMIRSGISVTEIKNIIDNRTFNGLMAQLEFLKWSKIK